MWFKSKIPILSFNKALLEPNGCPDAEKMAPDDSSPPSPRGIVARHDLQCRSALALRSQKSSPEEFKDALNDREDGSSDGLGLQDPRPEDVYDEIRRKHKQKVNKGGFFGGLFNASLLSQLRRGSFHKPTVNAIDKEGSLSSISDLPRLSKIDYVGGATIDQQSMDLYNQSNAFDLLRELNLSSLSANHVLNRSATQPSTLVGYQICLLYPEDISHLDEDESRVLYNDTGSLPLGSTLENSDVVHQIEAIVPPLPSIGRGHVDRSDPEEIFSTFKHLTSKDFVDEDIASFRQRIRLVVDTLKVKDRESGKNRSHFVMVKPDGEVDIAPLRRSADKQQGYYFTVLRRVKLVDIASTNFI